MMRLYHGDPVGLPPRAPQPHSRLVLGAIEAPAGQDEQLGQLFRQMRQATGLTSVMLAARLGIHPATLALFESGAVLALPEWNETVRIVTALARLVGLDPAVALERIQSQRSSGPVQTTAPARSAEPPPVPPVPLRQAPFQSAASQLSRMPQPDPRTPRAAHVTSGPLPMRQAAPMALPTTPPGPTHGNYAAYARAQSPGAMPPPRVLPDGAQMAPAAPIAPAPREYTPAPHVQNAQHHISAPPSRLELAPGDNLVHGVHQHGGTLSPINPLQPPLGSQRPRQSGGRQSAAPAVARRRAGKISYKLLAAPIVLVPALWYTVQNPTTVHAALDQLPEPIPRIARAGMDIVLIGTASTKDGMKLITVADPRNRKGDKLPTR